MRTGTDQGVSDNEGAGGGCHPESMLRVSGRSPAGSGLQVRLGGGVSQGC